MFKQDKIVKRKRTVFILIYLILVSSIVSYADGFIQISPKGGFNYIINPSGIVVDTDGYIYVVDTGNSKVKKFKPDGTQVNTFGVNGNNNGEFDSPRGIALDNEGNIYIADTNNQRIQKLDPSGKWLAAYGKYGSENGEFCLPDEIVVDASGNIYVTDNNCRIQKLDSDGKWLATYKTFGAYGSAIGDFRGLSLDKSGRVYVADNSRIYKMKQDGTWETTFDVGSITGNTVCISGITLDKLGNIYAADDNCVYKLSNEGKLIKSWSCEEKNVLWTKVSVSDEGNVYVADSDNRILKLNDDGTRTVIFSNKSNGNGYFLFPSGIAYDANGCIYVADTGNNRIQKFAPDGTWLATYGKNITEKVVLNNPGSVAVDRDGNIFISDTYNKRILKLNSEGKYISEFKTYGYCKKITLDKYGYVYVTDDGSISKFKQDGTLVSKWGSNQVVLGHEGDENGLFFNIGGIAVDNNGYIYVADTGNNRIQKFSPKGTWISTWGTQYRSQWDFNSPMGVAVDAEGYIYVADTGNHCVRRFDCMGNEDIGWKKGVDNMSALFNPYGLAIDKDGNICTSDNKNHCIRLFKSNNTIPLSTPVPSPKPSDETPDNREFYQISPDKYLSNMYLTFSGGIAADKMGDLYCVSSDEKVIRKFDSDGQVIKEIKISGNFDESKTYNFFCMAIDENGYFYLVDNFNHGIYKLNPDGSVILALGPKGQEPGQFSHPTGIAVDKSGNFFVADNGNARVQKFNSNGEFLTSWGRDKIGNGELMSISMIALDKSGNVYVSDEDNGRIRKFTTDGKLLATFGSEGYANGEFIRPEGIAVDDKGYIYVVDSYNNRVQKLNADGSWNKTFSAKGFDQPERMALGNNGIIYVLDSVNSVQSIYRFDENGTWLSTWECSGNTLGQYRYPEGIAVDKFGRLFVADSYNDRVQIFKKDNSLLTAVRGLNHPTGVCLDNDGKLYVADTENYRIEIYKETEDKLFSSVNSFRTSSKPRGVAVDKSGNIYVICLDNIVRVYNAQYEQIKNWSDNLSDPYKIAVDGDGNIYVYNYGYIYNGEYHGSGMLVKFNQSGTCLAKWGPFWDLGGIALDSENNVFAADMRNHRILKLDQNGKLIHSWGSKGFKDGQFNLPRNVAVDAQGNVYVTDYLNHRIQQLDAQRNLTITGYVSPDLGNIPQQSALKAGFKVEISGTDEYTFTDKNGCFTLLDVPQNSDGYTLRISKAGYLSRDIKNIVVDGSDICLGYESPVILWPGDISVDGIQDNAINISDIMMIARAFNSVSGCDAYNEECDFNKDNAINIMDIMIVAKHFNKTVSDYFSNMAQ